MLGGLFTFAKLRPVKMIGGGAMRTDKPRQTPGQKIGAGLPGQDKKKDEQRHRRGPQNAQERQEYRKRRYEMLARIAASAGQSATDSASALTDGARIITDKADAASRRRGDSG